MPRHQASRTAFIVWGALALGLPACLGDIAGGGTGSASGGDDSTTTPRSGGSTNTPGSGSGSPSSPGIAPGETVWPARFEGEPSGLRRLSRDELVASLEMLTGSAPVRDDLPEEQRPGHGPLLLSGTSFIANELGKLKQVMTEFATRVAPAMLMRSGCALTQQAQRDCLTAWAGKLAEQAFRRAPRTTELARLQKIFELAGATRDDDIAAVQGALAALFQAPSFLYRLEIGTPLANKPGVRALDANQIATRLSYLATLAPPDTELLDAAKTGRLKDGAERARQFARLAGTERGKRALAVFVLEWLGANERKVNQKSTKYLTGLGTDFENAIRASAESTIRKVVLESPDPTVGGLLTSEAYLTDAAVLKIRAAAGSGRTATGDAAETARAGLMMHPHVLAAHTKEDGASPFQIGVFVREAFLCEPVPSAPPGAADMAKTDVPAGLTTRESLDYRTGGGVCQGCHQQFAPLGYAFLPFDPVGRWVRVDPSGKAWDLAGNITPYSGQPLAFKSPGELVRSLAKEPQVHGCFAQSALEWTFGRGLVAEEKALVLALNDVAKRTRGGIAAIFEAIVASPDFVNAIAPR